MRVIDLRSDIADKPSLEAVLQQAISKVNGEDEASLCHFIPLGSGYMHRFTLKKMKRNNPAILYELIQTHIIQVDNPQKIQVRPAEQSSCCRIDRLCTINEAEMERIIALAGQAQDLELLKILQAKQDSYSNFEEGWS